MSNKEVKIVNGSLDGHILKNAASEHTLNELLDAIKKMEKASGSSSSSSRATKQQNQNTDSVRKNTKATDELTKAKQTLAQSLLNITVGGFRVFGQTISTIAGGLTGLTENVVNLSAEMIQTQPEITDFSSALANSRLNVLGLGTAIHRLTEMFVGNFRIFENLTQNGIFLGDRINRLSADFAGLGIDASTLTSILGQNANMFARFGSASAGANRALDGLRSVSADTREELRYFGIGFEEQAEIFARGFARNTIALQRGNIVQEQVVDLTARYARDLRRLAELTGASVNDLEEASRKAEMQTAFQIFLENLRNTGNAIEANQLEQQVMSLYSAGADGMAEALMGELLDLPTLTDAATSARGFVTGADQAITALIDLARNTDQTEEEFNRSRANILRELGSQQMLAEQHMLGTSALLSQMDSGAQEALQVARNFRYINEETVGFAGDINEAGKTLTAFDTAMVELRTVISEIASAFTENQNIINFLERASDGLRSMSENLSGDWLETFTNNLRNFDITKYNPLDEEGRMRIRESFFQTANLMKQSFTSFWEGENGVAMRNTISNFFKFMVEEIIIGIDNVTGLLSGTAKDIQTNRLTSSASTGFLTDEQQDLRNDLLNTQLGLISNIEDQIKDQGYINDHFSNLLEETLDEIRPFYTNEEFEDILNRLNRSYDDFARERLDDVDHMFDQIIPSFSERLKRIQETDYTDRSGFLGIGRASAEEIREKDLEQLEIDRINFENEIQKVLSDIDFDNLSSEMMSEITTRIEEIRESLSSFSIGSSFEIENENELNEFINELNQDLDNILNSERSFENLESSFTKSIENLQAQSNLLSISVPVEYETSTEPKVRSEISLDIDYLEKQIAEIESQVTEMIDDIDQSMKPFAGIGSRLMKVPETRAQQIQELLSQFDLSLEDFSAETAERLSNISFNESVRIDPLELNYLSDTIGEKINSVNAPTARSRESIVRTEEETEDENQNQTEPPASQPGAVKELKDVNINLEKLIKLMTQEVAAQNRTANNISGLGSDLMKGIPN